MEEIKTIDNIKEENKKEKISNVKLVFSLVIIGFIIEIIILFIIKSQVETFSWNQLLKWLISGFIIFGGIMGGFHYYNRNKEKVISDIKKKFSKQPEPITFLECQNLVNKMMYSPRYAQYLGKIEKEYVIGVGENVKSDIYVLIARGRFLDNGIQQKYVIMINMHYPENKKCVLINPSEYEIMQRAKGLASYPEKEKEYEDITTRNASLGVETIVRKPVKQEEKKEDKEKLKEDML